jgi:hypothetical protein
MITPDDKLPPDDSDEDEMDDQQSQRDIHSNGLDEDYEAPLADEDDPESLKQAYKAAESSYTLDFDDEDEDDYDD